MREGAAGAHASIGASDTRRAPRTATPRDLAARRRALWQRAFRLAPEDALPLAIEHRRIYILPTRRGWAFIGALLLMLVASINYGLSLGYALSFLLTGLFAASLLHTYRNLAGLRLDAIEAGTTFAGTPLEVDLRLVDAHGRARHGIEIATRDAASRGVLDMDARGTGQVSLALATDQRGPYPVGRLTLSSDWPIGLWRVWSYAHAPIEGLVYPAPEASPPALPERPGEDGGALAGAAEQGDVAGLRAYRDGDPPSRIAWKSAARSGPLQVRLMDAASGPARIDLSFESATLLGLEPRLARLAAWVLAAEAAGAEYSLTLPGAAPLETARGAQQRERALVLLALYGLPAIETTR